MIIEIKRIGGNSIKVPFETITNRFGKVVVTLDNTQEVREKLATLDIVYEGVERFEYLDINLSNLIWEIC